MKIRVAFCGTKGGVGKTTLALNSAFYLSNHYKVLYLDKDLISLGSHILGFNGKGFHKAIINDLSEEEYVFKVNRNLTLFKFFSDPIMEDKLHKEALAKKDKLEKAYLNVFSEKYDVIIVDYGMVFRIDDPLAYDEVELFRKYFPEYHIATVGITDAILEDIISTAKYFKRITDEAKSEPLAFVINMLPTEINKEEIDQVIEQINEILKCEIVTIPFREEFMSKEFGKYEELVKVGKIIEKRLNS
ncbi:MAG: ParA family protein [Saccharolobus sp.]